MPIAVVVQFHLFESKPAINENFLHMLSDVPIKVNKLVVVDLNELTTYFDTKMFQLPWANQAY